LLFFWQPTILSLLGSKAIQNAIRYSLVLYRLAAKAFAPAPSLRAKRGNPGHPGVVEIIKLMLERRLNDHHPTLSILTLSRQRQQITTQAAKASAHIVLLPPRPPPFRHCERSAAIQGTLALKVL
jgi:hypothetical protein